MVVRAKEIMKQVSRYRLPATVLALMAATGAAAAQTSLLTAQVPARHIQTSIEPLQDWQVTCDQEANEQSLCSISVSAAAHATGGRLVKVRLSQLPVKDRTTPLFAIETPLELLLSKGIEMKVDGGPTMRLAFRSCHPDGCLAPFSLNSKIARQFRKGQVLNIRVFDLEAQAVDIPLSLRGFTAAEQRAGM